MKISFMTLGCPNWDLDTICRRGREYGFDGVDFRGYLDEIDITKLPLFTTQAAETRKTVERRRAGSQRDQFQHQGVRRGKRAGKSGRSAAHD